MKFLVFAFLFALIGSSLADRTICPHPSETGVEVADERIILHKPEAGHAILEMDLSTRVVGRRVACFTLVTESQNTGPHIVSLGRNSLGGFAVKIFTEEREGLAAKIQAYLPKE